MRYSLDRTWRRPNAGDVVLAGSPTRAFRLTAGGRRIAEALEQGVDVPDSARLLIDRLVDAGAVHPLPDASSRAADPTNITAVIPAYVHDDQSAERVARLVAGLSGLAAIIVIDDASPLTFGPLDAGTTAVTVVRRETNGGPAAARNTGLERVKTSHVVFIDTDVECRTEDVTTLASWLVASDASAIAPRIRTDDDGSVLGAYEAVRSPLDMGDRPARVRGGTRVGWLPAAVLLCNAESLRSINGFDESLRTGEDVDLVWRLDAAGLRCRYEPSIEVFHHRRTTLPEMIHQRRGYGESTAPLHSRHGDIVAPARGSWTSVGTWVSLVVGLPLVGLATAITTTVVLSRKLKFVPNNAVESLRLSAMTHAQVGRNLASAATRVWWPIAVVLAVFSRRARLTLCAAALVPALAEWWEKRPRLDPVRFTLLRILDDGAYGIGVWTSVFRHRDPAPLIPSIHAPNAQRD